MGLVIRNGRSYLYRRVRKGGKVTSEYAGSGDFATLAGRLEALEREERRRELAEERNERDRLEAEDSPVAEMFHRVEIIARAAREAAGYHRHRRSEWRKRRTMKDAPKSDPSKVHTREILDRAQAGDETTRPIIREWLATRPALLKELDIATIAEDVLLKSACGKNIVSQEVLARDLRALADKLAGPDPSPIEHLLARRAAACWYAVNVYEKQYADSKEATLKMGTYLQERIDRAHRRLMASLKTLATVRRLARRGPLVAVNVEQSVTVELPAKKEPSGSPALTVADLLRAAPMG